MVLSYHVPGRTEKNKETLHDNRCLDTELNGVPTEYMSECGAISLTGLNRYRKIHEHQLQSTEHKRTQKIY
jgi:hypothetical protein